MGAEETSTENDGKGNGSEGGEASSSRRISVEYLDDIVAAAIVVFYGFLVVMVMAGAWKWSNLPESLQYWVTNALVLALGLLFGKGAYRFRQRRQGL